MLWTISMRCPILSNQPTTGTRTRTAPQTSSFLAKFVCRGYRKELRKLSSDWRSISTALPAVLIPLLLGVTLKSELNQTIDELRIGEACGGPQLGIHADRGKAGHGVDFVQVDLAGLGIHQEIHAREPRAVHCAEGGNGQFPHLLGLRFGQLRRNDELRAFIKILCGVIVELLAGHDFSGYRGLRAVIAQ